jgi:hypothetical protein
VRLQLPGWRASISGPVVGFLIRFEPFVHEWHV